MVALRVRLDVFSGVELILETCFMSSDLVLSFVLVSKPIEPCEVICCSIFALSRRLVIDEVQHWLRTVMDHFRYGGVIDKRVGGLVLELSWFFRLIAAWQFSIIAKYAEVSTFVSASTPQLINSATIVGLDVLGITRRWRTDLGGTDVEECVEQVLH